MAQHKFHNWFGFLLFAMLLALPQLAFGQDDPTESHRAVIQRVYDEAYSAGDFTVFEEAFAPEYVIHGLGNDQSAADYQQSINQMRAALPDFAATVEVLIADEEWTAARVILSGTFEAPWDIGGSIIEPNNKLLEWSLISLQHFNASGLVDEEFFSYDALDLLIQMDASPLPRVFARLLDTGRRSPIDWSRNVTEGMEEAHIMGFTRVIEESINNGDIPVINEVMAENYLTTEPFGNFDRERFARVIEGFRAAVPDLHVTIDAIVAEGDWLSARLIYTGTFTESVGSGAFVLEANNQPIRFIINVMVRFDETGMGIADYKEYNRLGWLQQLELLPS